MREEANLAEYVERLWNPREDVSAGLARRDRAPGRFRAYVPDELGTTLPTLGKEAAQAAEDALVVLARADERIGTRGRYLSHLLIRSESISSSWIEGNRVSPKRLAIAEVFHHGPRVALDVIANVHATEAAIAGLADRQKSITVADLEALQHVIEPRLTPGLRQEQNWVGGPGWSPLRADFVPPPEAEVPRLMKDLARFASSTSGNPVVRAAMVHAQFETIHPFVDGNGRTGRALIHTVFARADVLRNTLIPISTVFAGDTDAYIAGLGAYRATPPRVDDWITGFSTAVERAADNAVQLSQRIEALDLRLRETLVESRRSRGINPAMPRRDALVLKILANLSSEPVLTVDGVAERWEASSSAAHRGLVELAEAGILARTKDRKGRLLCFTSDAHLALVALTERSNRVGGIDTSVRAPGRGPSLPEVARVGYLSEDVHPQADEVYRRFPELRPSREEVPDEESEEYGSDY